MSEDNYITCLCILCSGKIEFPEEGIGYEIACPHCGAATTLYKPSVPVEQTQNVEPVCTPRSMTAGLVPPALPAAGKPITSTEPSPIMAPPQIATGAQTKRCPFCAELILREAIKCRHCGEFLDIQRTPPPPPPPARVRALPAPEFKERISPWIPFLIGGSMIVMLLLFSTGLLHLLTKSPEESTEPASYTGPAPITQKKHITAHEFGASWPLTVQEGDVYSRRLPPIGGQLPQIVAIFKSGSTEYGLNGTALTRGYSDINSIRIREVLVGVVPEDTIFMYKDINELITFALENENPPPSSP